MNVLGDGEEMLKYMFGRLPRCGQRVRAEWSAGLPVLWHFAIHYDPLLH